MDNISAFQPLKVKSWELVVWKFGWFPHDPNPVLKMSHVTTGLHVNRWNDASYYGLLATKNIFVHPAKCNHENQWTSGGIMGWISRIWDCMNQPNDARKPNWFWLLAEAGRVRTDFGWLVWCLFFSFTSSQLSSYTVTNGNSKYPSAMQTCAVLVCWRSHDSCTA